MVTENIQYGVAFRIKQSFCENLSEELHWILIESLKETIALSESFISLKISKKLVSAR